MDKFVTRLVIIHEDERDRNSIILIVELEDMYEVVGSYQSIINAERGLVHDNPDIIIWVNPKGTELNKNVLLTIRRKNSNIKTLFISDQYDENTIINAFTYGISGFLDSKYSVVELMEALHLLVNDGAPMSKVISKTLIDHFRRNPNSPLSKRETEVLEQIASGKTYRFIAEILGIGKETVKTHIRSIFNKLDVQNKSEAVRIALLKKYV
ncbi:MAG: response regulator transcription factor [Cyclobacteriaceae bacterium]